MGTPLGPKYIPYTYMDPLGKPDSGKTGPYITHRSLGDLVSEVAATPKGSM